jgi:hypothetical protein
MTMKTAGGGKPFRLSVKAICSTDADSVRRNMEASKSYPFVTSRAKGASIAIVGGGPSTTGRIPDIKKHDEVWGINHMAAWLSRKGIDAAMVSVDGAEMVGVGCGRAFLASCCHPEVFRQFPVVEKFDLAEYVPGGVSGGTTTATRAAVLALRMGYRKITFYGCEGSYDKFYHVAKKENIDREVIVRAGRKDYRTSVPMMLQAEDMSDMIREFPGVFREKCGGLLRGMMRHPDWEVVAVSKAMRDHLVEVNGVNLFEREYRP